MAVAVRYLLRGDTAEAWETKNPLLLRNEIAYDMTNRRIKFGDGNTLWKDLPYVKPDVINDLVTGGADVALSAEQGVTLKEMVEELRTQVENGSFEGAEGKAGTIQITKVTTGAAGSNASVVNVGTENEAKLEFTIPRGATGAKGDKGDKGDTGPAGSNATVSIGTVTTTGSGYSVTKTSAGALNFTFPEIVNSVSSGTGMSSKVLSAYQGYFLNYWSLFGGQHVNYENWTFTLSDGSSVTKAVALMTTNGKSKVDSIRKVNNL